jgi:glycosyltransferase involved in cell wall biosynthesis
MSGKFVVAAPARWDGDNNAHALANHGLLRFCALGTRRGTVGVPAELTRLNPWIGLTAYIAAKTMGAYEAESFRFRLHRWFDRWVKRQLLPGDHIISSFGFANACFKWVQAHGGKTFLSSGNSHPENFWTIIEEEHRRWKCTDPPIAQHHYQRSLAMMDDVDFILSPSSFVTRSFLQRGFKPEQILKNVYPIDLACFQPSRQPRPKDRPLTVISTGALSFRKGTPYLLEAFRLVLEKVPTARLLLTRVLFENVVPILEKYSSLPIDWAPSLPHPELAERLRDADIFVLPSLEDGFARTVTEALACGLPVITTENTGASDVIVSGKNGEVVPVRDSVAIAEAILKWWEIIRAAESFPLIQFDISLVSWETFERTFLDQLVTRGLVEA